ncbi:hypothetical protein RND81_13G187900 [Saponaria officinalis]|uniref:VQ domain-containing protein n=1 Tax=Saponaria officinalis TaxID=3572 RepID=A0AAW1H2K3_SAPOF
MSQQYDVNSLQKSSRTVKKRPASNNTRQPTPKVYKVAPMHFRELVQKLTGAQQTRQNTLQNVAPPPVTLNPHLLKFRNSTHARAEVRPVLYKVKQELNPMTVDQKPFDMREGWEGMTELNMSPNFQAWFNFAMLSPGPEHISH